MCVGNVFSLSCELKLELVREGDSAGFGGDIENREELSHFLFLCHDEGESRNATGLKAQPARNLGQQTRTMQLVAPN